MSQSLTIPLYNRQQAKTALTAQVFPFLGEALQGSRRFILSIKPETRSLLQNARLWAMLTEISQQVDWYGRKLTPEEWKEMATAALKKQKVVPGIDGGFVVIGSSTRTMTKAELGELMDFLEAFGAERNVKFSAYEERHADT